MNNAPQVRDAVVLMAGRGSRLRANGDDALKPLTRVGGRPLFSHLLAGLIAAGIQRVVAVTGFEADMLLPELRRLVPPTIELVPALNPEWELPNGVSLGAAAPHVSGHFLLTMGDHIFDHTLLPRLTSAATPDELSLAVDRKIDSVFDLADAMKVQTRGDRIIAIGKTLEEFNAIDTGFFVCPPDVFDYVDVARSANDCSVARVVQLMAREKRARAVDVGDAWWQDVDTTEMLRAAEERLAAQV